MRSVTVVGEGRLTHDGGCIGTLITAAETPSTRLHSKMPPFGLVEEHPPHNSVSRQGEIVTPRTNRIARGPDAGA